MKKLQTYVLKEIFKAFVPALLVFMLIMTLGFCVQLLHEGLDVVRLAGLPIHLMSFSLPLVLPSAFLTAIIMGLGRMEADNEVTAMRAAGVNLLHVLVPVAASAVLLSGLASYLQFETVPRARTSIEVLKDEAIKQILVDKVALSSQRQFSFPRRHVQYAEFRDGRMRDIVIVETEAGIPASIVTAAYGTIAPDPARMEFMLLKLHDCAVTQIRSDEAGGPVTLMAREGTLRIRATPDVQDVGAKVKHLSFTDLLSEWFRLRSAVRRHDKRYKNPSEVAREAVRNTKLLHAELAELDQRLDERIKKLTKLTQEEEPKHRRTIELKQEEIVSAQAHKRVLETQQVSYTDEIRQLEDNSTGQSAGFERIVELQKLLDDVRIRIDGLDAKIADAQAEIKKANNELREDKADCERIQREVQEIEQKQQGLQQRVRQQTEIRVSASDQDEMRSLNIRIHKRLAQALAVLAFAMIGMPLGIMTRRRSVMVSLGVSFAVVLLLFYPFLIVGQIAADNGVLPTALAMWSGNAVTFLIGVALTLRVLRK